ncbi:hypothetical protein [Streptosporangium sp. NPDC000396]|uniref:hypothetical protein n=1 Tax=Streptosporangium sp. NPDC000396 TaxID=3366185 RepID=UPI003694F8A1
MIKLRNALAAGTMVASVLIAPVTVVAQSAGADTVAGTTATASAPFVQRDGDGSANGAANGSRMNRY